LPAVSAIGLAALDEVEHGATDVDSRPPQHDDRLMVEAATWRPPLRRRRERA
jgi:hypothetical protein